MTPFTEICEKRRIFLSQKSYYIRRIFLSQKSYYIFLSHKYVRREAYDAFSFSWYGYGGVATVATVGWLLLVGIIKSQVSFEEYRLFYRAFLQKRPII